MKYVCSFSKDNNYVISSSWNNPSSSAVCLLFSLIHRTGVWSNIFDLDFQEHWMENIIVSVSFRHSIPSVCNKQLQKIYQDLQWFVSWQYIFCVQEVVKKKLSGPLSFVFCFFFKRGDLLRGFIKKKKIYDPFLCCFGMNEFGPLVKADFFVFIARRWCIIQ